jgi:hypothetical protein
MREIAKQELIGFFIQQQQVSVGPSAENVISGVSRQVLPNLMLAQIGAIPTPSSVGSFANAKHLVDDIVEDTPCKLVIPYGRKLDKFQEVGTAMALTGYVFPNPPPPEYAWVQVVSVSDESCEIELLGDARNQYILWHRRDIVLNTSPSPFQPSQERVPPQDPDTTMVEYMIGGEHGGNNDNSMTFKDVVDVGNTEQPMLVVE